MDAPAVDPFPTPRRFEEIPTQACIRPEIHQDIDIGVGTEVAPGGGAEDDHLPNVVFWPFASKGEDRRT